jgi:GR25 family glycosyltransferase involved in LPS biosynthesis
MLIQLINLDRSPERLRQFTEVNRHLSHVERFPAIDGGQQDIAALIRNGTIEEPALERYTAGNLGLALTQLALWEKAIAAGEVLTVCEDDAIFHRHFERQAPELIARLPADWDIVLWGWNFDAPMMLDLGISFCVVFGEEQHLRQNAEAFQDAPAEPYPMRLLSAFGTFCYSVSAKGARALRDFCLPIRPMELRLLWPEPGNKVLLRPAGRLLNRGIDVMMAIAYPDLRAFVSVPPLVVSKNEHFRSATQRDVFLAEMFRGRGNAGPNPPPNSEPSS